MGQDQITEKTRIMACEDLNKKILSFLPFKDICRMRQVSRAMQSDCEAILDAKVDVLMLLQAYFNQYANYANTPFHIYRGSSFSMISMTLSWVDNAHDKIHFSMSQKKEGHYCGTSYGYHSEGLLDKSQIEAAKDFIVQFKRNYELMYEHERIAFIRTYCSLPTKLYIQVPEHAQNHIGRVNELRWQSQAGLELLCNDLENSDFVAKLSSIPGQSLDVLIEEANLAKRDVTNGIQNHPILTKPYLTLDTREQRDTYIQVLRRLPCDMRLEQLSKQSEADLSRLAQSLTRYGGNDDLINSMATTVSNMIKYKNNKYSDRSRKAIAL